MNPTEVREILERAAAAVEPSETDPAARMVSLGRRSVQRRRAWGAAGSVAAAVAAAVALPFAVTGAQRPDPVGTPGTTVSFGGLSVTVPQGWRTSRVATFNACNAEPHTVYLAQEREPAHRAVRSSSGPAGSEQPVPRGQHRLVRCTSDGQAWMAVVQKGAGQTVNPERLQVKDDRLLLVEHIDERVVSSMWAYRAYAGEIQATTAFISGDGMIREQLLERVTWPADPAPPVSGGLALPDRITSALTDVPPDNGMVVATDTATLAVIRTRLRELRDPVPTGEACTLQKPGSVGISLGDVNVVLGDATCPQAISTGGGRVRAPAGLGQELLGLIVASDRAATELATKD